MYVVILSSVNYSGVKFTMKEPTSIVYKFKRTGAGSKAKMELIGENDEVAKRCDSVKFFGIPFTAISHVLRTSKVHPSYVHPMV